MTVGRDRSGNAELLETLLARSVDGILAFDAELRVVFWNAALESIAGVRRESALGRSVFEVLPSLAGTEEEARLREALDGKTSTGRPFEVVGTARRGFFEAYSSPHRGPDGRVDGGIAIIRDVTERWRAEELLRETESRFRTMADTAPVLLWMAGPDSMCEFFNESWLAFTKRTLEQEVGVGWAEGIHYEDLERALETYMEAFSARRPFTMKYRLRRHDGEYRWLLDTGVPRISPDGTFMGYIGSCTDITEQKAVEDSLAASLREKDVLLREIHHRVKNNLQVISSLLRLQSSSIADPDARRIFDDGRERIRSMALVHESLYRSESFSQVDFAEYVERLTVHLMNSYRHDGAPVRLDLDLTPTQLDIERAIPCGLILNELVTNSLKHAFRERDGGRLTVALRRDDRGRTALAVRDDGPGLPEGAELGKGATLGLQLVTTLVAQIGAELDLSRDGGTEFTLRLPASAG